MIDFSNLKALDVNDQTEVEYTFTLIPGEPSVWLAPATDDNIAYLDQRLKLSAERAEKLAAETKARGGKSRAKAKITISSDDFEEDRESDRVLLAKCCCRRWGTAPRDVNGDSPKFSEENCLAFLRALPNYMIDGLRSFSANTYNFIPRVGDDFKPLTEEAKDALGN